MQLSNPVDHLSAILLAAGLMALVHAPQAYAAGFDCSKASSAIEKAICADPGLSTLDGELSAVYSKALASAPDREALKGEQRQWLTQIRNKCLDNQCLAEVYRKRIAEIAGLGSAPVTAAPTAPLASISAEISAISVAAAPVDERVAEAHQEAAPVAVHPAPLPSALVVGAPAAIPAYQAPVPTVADPQFSGTGETVSVQGEGLTSLQKKLIGAILLLNAVVSVFLHRKGSLTIYSDYTDATFTSLVPLAALAFYFGAKFFEAPEQISIVAATCVLALMLLFVVKATFQQNRNILMAIVALTAKLTIIVAYYAAMVFLLFGSGSARRKGERRDSFEARQRREARQNQAIMAALTAAFVSLTAWICREEEFTSLGDYVSFRRTANA